MDKADKIINIVRNLKEQMASGGMTTGSSSGSPGFSGSTDPKGPVAGYDPLMGFKNKNKKDIVDFRRVPLGYKKWVKSLKR